MSSRAGVENSSAPLWGEEKRALLLVVNGEESMEPQQKDMGSQAEESS